MQNKLWVWINIIYMYSWLGRISILVKSNYKYVGTMQKFNLSVSIATIRAITSNIFIASEQ